MNDSRARLLCIADVPNWIFQRHINYLQKYLSDEFDFSTVYRGQPFSEADFDLIYPLEFMLVEPEKIKDPLKYVTGVRSFISWAVWDFQALTELLRTHFRRVHVVSGELYNIFAPYLPGLAYVTHGVDLDLFTPRLQTPRHTGSLRLGWAGNRFTPVKGFSDYIAPLASLPGVELAYHGFADKNIPIEKMPEFYENLDVYVCASSYEGNNNALLEAAAMERGIVTTPVGTVPEYLQDQESALLVSRDPEQFAAAVASLRDDPEKRVRLGKQARKNLIEKGWSWKVKSEEYRQFFRGALESDLPSSESLHQWLDDQEKDSHLVGVLRSQHAVLREIHIGDRISLWEETNQRKILEHQLAEIRASETYQLLVKLAGNKTAHSLSQFFKRLIDR